MLFYGEIRNGYFKESGKMRLLTALARGARQSKLHGGGENDIVALGYSIRVMYNTSEEMWKVESDGFGWEQQIMTWQLGGSRATFTFTCTCTAIELELASAELCSGKNALQGEQADEEEDIVRWGLKDFREENRAVDF
ncbi:hypothetical protein AXG93_291s1250 [Marchantia polymorpha subsp. ruderalis]|uniref:Uncharacterized protein n=1 Tax=Marchantia polymorpha subsp. ruderalis TaxID=1480154 RepID=A0A176VG18_MARPO|nr:hypothetical protein AXG93_291s1250 [Marchantia polymorpha subsp. ruderalis]